MKNLLFAAALATASLTGTAAEVGMSLSVGQPGFYGQIDIGGYPPPPVIYRQPRVGYYVQPDRPPLYLRVPPGHAKNWSRYCGKYDACNERVYFVKDNWYRNEYAPRYRDRMDRRDGHRDGRRDDHRDNHRGNDKHNQGDNHGNNH
jgi:hypothetical protein